jgi:hypothetical protein
MSFDCFKFHVIPMITKMIKLDLQMSSKCHLNVFINYFKMSFTNIRLG